VAIILVIVLLLPVIIFSAIPHFLFGWTGNDSSDVKRMTDSAIHIGDIYENRFDSIVQDAVSNLIDRVVFNYPNPYITVNVELGSTNRTWFIAIMSVYYGQDLNVIDESVIVQMAEKMLVYETFTGGRYVSYTITDMLPDALMTLLGFSDEQRKWAELLVSVMNEDQTIDTNDAEYIGHAGIDFGSISFTDGIVDITYYNQADARWGDTLYGKTGTIGTSGCGPTALAIVVSSLTGKRVTPVETAEWAVRNGYRVEGNGSMHALIPDGARHYGLSVECVSRKDGQTIADALAEGKLVVAVMSKCHFTGSGHFIVLRGVTAEGKILIADPISVKRSEQLWDLSVILNEANYNAGGGGPFWVVW
jgi:hypothetical protein